MPIRTLAGLAALAALAGPATAQAADVIEPSTVAGSAVVAGGQEATLELECRPPAVALNAAATRLAPGITVRRSVPGADARSWRITVASRTGTAGGRARAVLRCVGLRLPPDTSSVKLRVETRREPLTLAPGATARVTLRCQPGYTATGYGVDGGRGDAPGLTLSAALPSTGGWTFRLANQGVLESESTLRIRCLERAVSGDRAGTPVRLAFDLARSSATETATGGSLSRSCGRRSFSVATGVGLEDGALFEGSYPRGARGARWTFAAGIGVTPVRTHLLCLARGSVFR